MKRAQGMLVCFVVALAPFAVPATAEASSAADAEMTLRRAVPGPRARIGPAGRNTPNSPLWRFDCKRVLATAEAAAIMGRPVRFDADHSLVAPTPLESGRRFLCLYQTRPNLVNDLQVYATFAPAKIAQWKSMTRGRGRSVPGFGGQGVLLGGSAGASLWVFTSRFALQVLGTGRNRREALTTQQVLAVARRVYPRVVRLAR